MKLKARELFLLSWVSGFVDTAGFLAIGGLFLAHVTGNFVLVGAELGRASSPEVACRLLVIPLFVLAVALGHRVCPPHHDSAAPRLLYAEAVLLALVAGAEYIGSRPLVIGFGVAAMGLQNTFMRRVAAGTPATTVMTGNLTQRVLDFMDGEGEGRRLNTFAAILGFVVGAACGAWAVLRGGMMTSLAPALALVILARGRN